MIKQFTASGIIVNPERSKTLVIFHNKLKKWLQPGGHVDPNELPCDAALREVLEEVGLQPMLLSCGIPLDIKPNNPTERQLATPFCILEEQIPARTKVVDGTPITEAAHIHIDMIYLMEHEEKAANLKLDEVSQAAWIDRNQILELKEKGEIFDGTANMLLSALAMPVTMEHPMHKTV